MEYSQRRYITAWISGLILAGIIFLAMYFYWEKDSCLKQKGVYVKGKISAVNRFGTSIKISCKVAGKEYIGRKKIFNVQLGDPVIVHYCTNDPNKYRAYKKDPRINIQD